VYDPDHHRAGQALGRKLRERGSTALVYDSVRDAGGQCVAVFVPRAPARARTAGHLSLHRGGRRLPHWFGKGEPQALSGTPGPALPR
jgi:RES domain